MIVKSEFGVQLDTSPDKSEKVNPHVPFIGHAANSPLVSTITWGEVSQVFKNVAGMTS